MFGSYDYINWRLTDERAVEQNWALEAGFVDLATHEISDELVALAHIPRSAIPRKVTSHAFLAPVSADAARQTGLPEGVPVFGGAADHIASAYAAGLVADGDVLLKFGGAGDIIVVSQTALPDPRLYLDYHLIPGLYAPNGCMAASGAALNWMAGIIAPGQARPHRELDLLAAAIPAGSDGVTCLPYFLGEKTPIHDPLARGTFTGLILSHGRGHLWRALLEAVAYGFRHHLEVLRDVGHATNRLFVSDGGSQSRVWMQIMADIAQQPLRTLHNHHGSSVGAAWLAAIGSGQDVRWEDIGRLVQYGHEIAPNPDNAARYERGYQDYRALYAALQPYFRRHA